MSIETHPVQANRGERGKPSAVPVVVTMRAYEVYCELYGPQESLITGWCRGGFATSELIVFLYAHSFPRDQWRMRADEASNGMQNV